MPAHQRSRFLLPTLLAVTLLPAAPLAEETVSDFPKELRNLGWKELQIPGERPARFTLAGEQTISIESQDGVSFIYRKLSDREQQSRTLSWSWRVNKEVPATDPASRSEDDRSLAVHLWFPDDSEPDFWQAIGSQLKGLFGVPRIGKVLTYTYGGIGKQRQLFTNPHLEPEGRIFLLQPSGRPIQTWVKEEIDLKADFAQAFQQPYKAPKYLALSADSDNSDSQSAGLIADLSFGN
ncbi:DUF3047 domain-containing protein [Rhodovibrionaceae bacterium A322]